jgi:hypothetical protein
MNYKNLIFSIIILFVVGLIYNKINYYISYQEKKDDLNLIKKYLLEDDKNIGKIVNNKRPKIWIYLNHEINSYKWIDFGSRNSKNLNKEYLELTLTSIINNCGKDFDILLLNNNSFEYLLNDWRIDLDKLSSPIKDSYRLYGLIRILNKYGGFIIEPNTIMFKSLLPIYNKILKTNKPVIGEFNNDSLDNYSQNLMPNIKFLGSNKNNKFLVDLERLLKNNILFDYTNDLKLNNYLNKWIYNCVLDNKINYLDGKYIGTKDINNNIIYLEDLMGDSFLNLNSKIYCLIIPDHELTKRNKYNWFIYLDKKEILESRTNIGKYLLLVNK